MSNHELNSGSEVTSGLDAASGLPGSNLNPSRDIFGQPLSKNPTALGSLDHPLLKPENNHRDGADQADPLTGLQTQNSTMGGHGYEFESGIAPIDYTVHLAGKALDAVDQVIESSTPVVRKVVNDAVTQISETVHDSIDTAQKNWNAPDNELRTTLNNRFNQAIGFAKQKITDLSADPDVKEAVNITTRLGRTVAERTKNFIETAQSVTESWVDQAFASSYLDESLSTTSASSGSSKSPFIGVIDTNFKPQSHGAQVADAIQQSDHRPDWLGDGVGTGQWTDSLVQFVDAAKASGRSGAVVNLSFDLTQINPDGSVSTRFELTAEEEETLKYAQANGVLVVVSAGNQNSTMSALGQASHNFDNVIAVGATEGGQRADYSSYGAGLDVVTSGQGKAEGTSLAAARVTGAIAKIWDTNPQLNYRQVIQALESTAIDLHKPGWDADTGFGQLNTSAAINLAEDLTPQPQTLSDSQLQNTIERDQADQNFHNGTFERDLWSESGAIPTERPNRVLEGDGIQPEPASSIASPLSGHLLKYEPGVPLQYDEQVKQWQQRMSDLGYEIDVDGFYGEQSAGVARQFQSNNGLTDDGIVGADTWAASFGSTTATTSSDSSSTLDQAFRYEPGSLTYNPDVKRWQQRMSERGWNIIVDGLYGEESERIARQFQQEKGLTVDGIVGSQTWAATFDTSNVTVSSSTAINPDPSGISDSNATQALIDAARSYIGVREQGENRGAEVEQFQSVIGGAQGEAWCMSFVQYCIQAAEGATQSDSSVVRSEGCVDVWNRSPASLKHSRPEVGSLVIWQDRGKTTGHVGIVESVHADGSFTTIEGNTNDDSGTGAEGVHRRHRTMADTSKRMVLGFLKVFPGDGLTGSVSSVTPDSDSSTSSTLPTGELLKYEAGTPLMRGESVKAWQEFLNEQGHSIAIDGVYGSESAEATRRFQQSQGIADDGIVGQETWAATFNTTRISPNYGSADAAEVWNEAIQIRETRNQVLDQIREIENTIPGEYDPYIVSQTLRRKTDDKYRGGSFEQFTGWQEGLPFNKHPGNDANSTYARSENLEEFQGSLPLENGMELPTAHFLAALSAQFGTILGAEPWNLTYVGDLGSVAGAMQHPDDWVTSDSGEAEVAREQLASLSSSESKLPIAVDAKSPPEQLDADIVAHVVGDFVKSKAITISEAISEVSQMPKREIYDVFLRAEFGISLSDLNDPITGLTTKFEVRSELQDRMSSFIYDYVALQNVNAAKNEIASWFNDDIEHEFWENLYNPLASINLDPENSAMVADYFMEHLIYE